MSAPDIDRIGPTLRPAGLPIMRQAWSELMFLHWPVPPAVLRALVPPALEIDTFEGEAWVGLVPFTVSGSRLRLLPPLPFVSHFHEINVRTYVHYRGRDPGVWFFSLDAAQAMVVAAARLLYKLPYHHARFRLAVQEAETTAAPRQVRFTSRRRSNDAGVELLYGPVGGGLGVQAAAAGTLEHFLAERYILYAARGPRLYRAQVHHSPYPLQAGAVQMGRETLLAANGLVRPDRAPLAHYARGVQVDIWPLRRVE